MPTIKEPKKASASTGGFEDDGKENQSTATCTIADPKNERGSGNVRDGCGSRREYRQMELLMVVRALRKYWCQNVLILC
ncbi:unnamed protein product [Fusarium graminearum]|nr:unnamed protein product [Fusarium graminearum]CAG1992834.1 unnamed protein product [Fusarium graminearum]VTO92635.1 unnamed protein product [Fusarium graminearum]